MSDIEKLLDLIIDIVADQTAPWKDKKAAIDSIRNSNGEADTAFAEFISWFDEGEEAE